MTRRLSVDLDRVIGNEGLRTMGVFLRESFVRMSQIVVNGSRLFGSGCQQSQIRSYVEWNGIETGQVIDSSFHYHAIASMCVAISDQIF